MLTTNAFAEIGALVGDPARASMLVALMDGRALTAAELQSVYVHPDLRGGGVAGALVAALLDLADEAGAERVVVHSSAMGESLYRRLGFGDARLLLQRPPED